MQTQQFPLYCTSCKLNFIAKKKKALGNESHLSFEIILPPNAVNYSYQSKLQELPNKVKQRLKR
jgi:hypothetical protein